MNTKANEQYRTNEKEILKVFIELLEKEDIQDITVNEICLVAHINRSTFYNHFHDIYDVLDRIMDAHVEKISRLFHKHPASKNGKENLKIILDYMKENQLFYRVSFHSPLYGRLSDGFHSILQNHEIRDSSRTNSYRFHFFQQGMMAMIMQWLDCGCDIPVVEVINIIDEFYPMADL